MKATYCCHRFTPVAQQIDKHLLQPIGFVAHAHHCDVALVQYRKDLCEGPDPSLWQPGPYGRPEPAHRNHRYAGPVEYRWHSQNKCFLVQIP